MTDRIDDPIRALLWYLKKHAVAGQPISDELLIGAEEHVREQCGGCTYYVQRTDPGRLANIAADIGTGMDKRDIARKYGVTLRRVQQIASEIFR